MSDLISRNEALALIESMMETYWDRKQILSIVRNGIEKLPSAESNDWLEKNKDLILQAGMEGREVEFRIGGRLFAIREKAQ